MKELVGRCYYCPENVYADPEQRITFVKSRGKLVPIHRKCKKELQDN